MKIKTAIEKAIEGGWYELSTTEKSHRDGIWNETLEEISYPVWRILLNIDFWKALEKVKGWDTEEYSSFSSEAEFRHHDFLINLWSGEKLEKAFDMATS